MFQLLHIGNTRQPLSFILTIKERPYRMHGQHAHACLAVALDCVPIFVACHVNVGRGIGRPHNVYM